MKPRICQICGMEIPDRYATRLSFGPQSGSLFGKLIVTGLILAESCYVLVSAVWFLAGKVLAL